MKPTEYKECRMELGGWEINLTSYKLGDHYTCKVDNVSPGAQIAAATAATREEAEDKALAKARERLAHTRRQTV